MSSMTSLAKSLEDLKPLFGQDLKFSSLRVEVESNKILFFVVFNSSNLLYIGTYGFGVEE